VIRIPSPNFSVNVSPGTMPVPVERKQPEGKLLSRRSQPTSDSGERALRPGI
jgi:hypothetical protein